jgi:hypothetical protein
MGDERNPTGSLYHHVTLTYKCPVVSKTTTGRRLTALRIICKHCSHNRIDYVIDHMKRVFVSFGSSGPVQKLLLAGKGAAKGGAGCRVQSKSANTGRGPIPTNMQTQTTEYDRGCQQPLSCLLR